MRIPNGYNTPGEMAGFKVGIVRLGRACGKVRNFAFIGLFPYMNKEQQTAEYAKRRETFV